MKQKRVVAASFKSSYVFFFVTRAIYSNVCIYEVKNSANRERGVSTLPTISSIQTSKQASTFSTHT